MKSSSHTLRVQILDREGEYCIFLALCDKLYELCYNIEDTRVECVFSSSVTVHIQELFFSIAVHRVCLYPAFLFLHSTTRNFVKIVSDILSSVLFVQFVSWSSR